MIFARLRRPLHAPSPWQVLRFLSEATLKVTTRVYEPNRILPPLLELRYTAVAISTDASTPQEAASPSE